MEFGELKGTDGKAPGEGGEKEKVVVEADQSAEDNDAMLAERFRRFIGRSCQLEQRVEIHPNSTRIHRQDALFTTGQLSDSYL